MTTRDVLIIGGGAAGASAAFHLAKEGHKITLLEKEKDPLIKPCGGGMAAAVQKWFPFNLMPVVDEIIEQVEFTWRLEDPVIAKLPGSAPFWIVRRELLDAYITTHAINEGAELLRDFSVIGLKREGPLWQVSSSDGRQLEAKAVIVADGSKSPWPSQFNLGPKALHYASTTSVRLSRRGELKAGSARFEFGLVHHGFAWAFPINQGVNVGVGSFIGNDLLNSELILKELLPSIGFDPNEGERKNNSLRVWNGHSSLHGNGILVIGDAASLCDPFLAEGLRPALMSGTKAASALNHWLRDETPDLKEYTHLMRKEWGESMAWGRRIAQVFYRFPKVGYQLGIKRPTAPQRIAQILSGEMGYGDIAQRVIKRLLFQGK